MHTIYITQLTDIRRSYYLHVVGGGCCNNLRACRPKSGAATVTSLSLPASNNSFITWHTEAAQIFITAISILITGGRALCWQSDKGWECDQLASDESNGCGRADDWRDGRVNRPARV